ncbi:hypothetical protein N9L20_02265 [Flavobacteriaceae bacterium]|nr:hypothetical protein [Flavobacteriaceae bacterium]
MKNLLFYVMILAGFSIQAQEQNDYLANSIWPIGHTNSAQTNSVEIEGPVADTRQLGQDEIQYQDLGQFYLGQVISGPYKDSGKKVIWVNGSSFVAKLDYENYNIISLLRITDKVESTGKHEAFIDLMDSNAPVEEKIKAGITAGISGLSSVYIMMNSNNEFLAAQPRAITVYADQVEGNPNSGIRIKKTFTLPETVQGKITGMNMTFDGYIVVVTDAGYLMAIDQDFEQHSVHRMKYSAEYNNPKVAFVRNSVAIDKDNGIYIASVNHMHKVIWDGQNLSASEDLGAWTAQYPNGLGLGSGSTPALMGFEDGKDQFVVITDGDSVMNMTLFWRNKIPKNWKGIKGLPSKRIAASEPVNFGNEEATYVQQEQGVTINGYGMIVVNNVPKNVPKSISNLAKKKPGVMWLFMGYMNGYEQFSPKGIEKLVWNPKKRKVELAWINTEVSDPTCVPFVADGNDMFYTIGSRNNKFTFEAIDAKTGESVFHYKIGGARYNGFYSAPTLDEEGRILYGGLWGVVRLAPKY